MSEATNTETEDKVIGTFQKSHSASIRVSLVEWEGNTYLDIREIIPSDKPGETFIFTKKGIRLREDLVGELQELLAQVSSGKQEKGPAD